MGRGFGGEPSNEIVPVMVAAVLGSTGAAFTCDCVEA
jgi:hypothetical protein